MNQTMNETSKKAFEDQRDQNIKCSEEYDDSISINFEEENDTVPVLGAPNIKYNVYLSKDDYKEEDKFCSLDPNKNFSSTKKLNFENLGFDIDNVTNQFHKLASINTSKGFYPTEDCKTKKALIIRSEDFLELPSRNLISREFLGLKVLETNKITSPSFSYYQEMKPKKNSFNGDRSNEMNYYSTDYREINDRDNRLSREFDHKVVQPPFTRLFSSQNSKNDSNIFRSEEVGFLKGIRRRLLSSFEEGTMNSQIENVMEGEIGFTECITKIAFTHLKGHFFKLLCKQNHCKILQRSLEKTSPEVLGMILNEIGKHIQTLITDQYGNYFFPKFYGKLSMQDRLIFLQFLQEANPSAIARNQQGSYCLQKIIESMNTKEEGVVFSEIFQDKIMELFNDNFGVRVIEKIISKFGEQNKYYFDIVFQNFVMFANNGSGLCLVKKIITTAQSNHTLSIIEDVILQNLRMLVEHHYGNYAVQVALERLGHNFSKSVYCYMVPNLNYYSNQKSSSRVIELCFEKGDESIVNHYVNFCAMTFCTLEMMRGSYSNYVIQTALKYGNRYSRISLANLMLNQVDKITEKGLRMKWKSIINSSLDLRKAY